MKVKKAGQFNKVEKELLHSRNQHRLPYNFNELIKFTPELAAHVFFNEFGNQSIDFPRGRIPSLFSANKSAR